jgi:hypothetical protein
MQRIESAVITVALAVGCPLTCFMFAWWGSALLFLVAPATVPEAAVVVCALAGFLVGLLALSFRYQRWLRAFYSARPAFAVSLYLSWSAMAIGLTMGLPVGNVLLGAAAGLYVGRRHRWEETAPAALERAARATAIFTAAVTGALTLAIGLLALQTRNAIPRLFALLGAEQVASATGFQVVFVVAAVTALTAAQFWLTRLAARRAFQWGREPRDA